MSWREEDIKYDKQISLDLYYEVFKYVLEVIKAKAYLKHTAHVTAVLVCIFI